MLFNSVTFLVFAVIVYGAYWSMRGSTRVQNWLLLVASYVFYGWWDWRFLSLIAISTVVDYTVGRLLVATDDQTIRKRLLVISVATNLGILGFFKYAGFFVDSANELLSGFGIENDAALRIVLPVGISFYTFQTMSYTIDVYRRTFEPVRRFDDFALFVAFFPQLVAGPIERASSLLGQIERPRSVTAADLNAGAWLITWGLFKKVVLADNLAPIADDVFAMNPERSGVDVLIGALAFTLQIYGDFSGYSDMARGLARLLGIELMVNFRLPYISENPSEFWERWHISLSSWLRDYLYIPLGGNRTGHTNRNLLLTMVLGGLWHGAAWNFVIWGFYHGLLLIGYRAWSQARPARPGATARAVRIGVMFGFTVIGWVIFRADSFEAIRWWFANLGPGVSSATVGNLQVLVTSSLVLALVGYWQYKADNLLAPVGGSVVRSSSALTALVLAIMLFGVRGQVEFIYFQF